MNAVDTALSQVIKEAMDAACVALSDIVTHRFRPESVDVSYHDPLELPNLLGDDREAPVCATYYQVEGGLSGFFLLIFPYPDVEVITRLLLGNDENDEELVISALGEVGNIVGNSFLTHLADHFDVSATPTPPQVARDMVGALLESFAVIAAAEGMARVPVIRTSFAQDDKALNTFLLWIADNGESPLKVEQS